MSRPLTDSDDSRCQPLLTVNDLACHLGSQTRPVRAVDGINFQIRKGEIVGLLGESGCGKSMTGLSLMRLLPPGGRVATGDVHLNDTALLDLPEQAMRQERGHRVAMIFQEPATSLNPVLTIGKQIGEAIAQHDAENRHQIQQRVIELLTAVGIPDPEQRQQDYPHQLSGGMKQRVMISIALAGRPELLIADEPTTALDVTIQAQILELLRDLRQKTGLAVLLITHDLGVVASLADRVAVMYGGKIIEMADCATFFKQPQHPYSQKLFGALPGINTHAQPLTVIPGMVPKLNQHFKGCRFVDRCHVTIDRCHDSSPHWQGENDDHGYCCHLKPEQSAANIPCQPHDNDDDSGPIRPSNGSASAALSPAPLLSVTDLKVHFPVRKGLWRRVVNQVKAVDGVNLKVGVGETLALVGESGCGKTTVGKGILRLLPTLEGTIQFNGQRLDQLAGQKLRQQRTDLQVIFQDPAAAMNPRMSVAEIIEEGMIAQGIEKNKNKRLEKVKALLKQVGLRQDILWSYPHEFSGGQRQRLCIARALAVNPKLIICDEPTSALDLSVQAQVLNLLKELQRNLGLSYLFITHDIAVVAHMAQRVAVMYLGRIVEEGTMEEILQAPRHPYTKALLSAVPRIHRTTGENKLSQLTGDLPSPLAPPAGCHFHPRCPAANDRCRTDYPRPVTISESHQACCFLLH